MGRFAGVTYEDRHGGTIDGRTLPATGLPYIEALKTTRYDGGAVAQFIFAGRYVVSARIAGMQQHHDHQFGDVLNARAFVCCAARWSVSRLRGPAGRAATGSSVRRASTRCGNGDSGSVRPVAVPVQRRYCGRQLRRLDSATA
jgi:hypothetical protein